MTDKATRQVCHQDVRWADLKVVLWEHHQIGRMAEYSAGQLVNRVVDLWAARAVGNLASSVDYWTDDRWAGTMAAWLVAWTDRTTVDKLAAPTEATVEMVVPLVELTAAVRGFLRRQETARGAMWDVQKDNVRSRSRDFQIGEDWRWAEQKGTARADMWADR